MDIGQTLAKTRKSLGLYQLLISRGQYTREKRLEQVIPLRSLPLYHISVFAGTGQFLDSDLWVFRKVVG